MSIFIVQENTQVFDQKNTQLKREIDTQLRNFKKLKEIRL